MSSIRVVRESRRGCGYRKAGGLYLVSDGPSMLCRKLPVPLIVCPVCGGGIKPARGWTWVHAGQLLGDCDPNWVCRTWCTIPEIGRAGLLWIGEKFYPTPDAWTREALQMGVSRRIPAVPKEFKLGETWVLVAHRKAIHNPDDSYTPAVFHIFKPQRIEYVVNGDEDEETLDRLEKRGLTLVKVERAGEQQPLPLTEQN